MVADRLIIMKKFVLSSSSQYRHGSGCHGDVPLHLYKLLESALPVDTLNSAYRIRDKRDTNMGTVGWKVLVLSFAYLASGKR